jgi:hypothetical protein
MHTPTTSPRNTAATATALPARYYVDAGDGRARPPRRSSTAAGNWSRMCRNCATAGDHVVADFAGLPVLAVRGADDAIRVFHNVCRHRAGPIAQCDGLPRSRCVAATTAGPTRWKASCVPHRK